MISEQAGTYLIILVLVMGFWGCVMAFAALERTKKIFERLAKLEAHHAQQQARRSGIGGR